MDSAKEKLSARYNNIIIILYYKGIDAIFNFTDFYNFLPNLIIFNIKIYIQKLKIVSK